MKGIRGVVGFVRTVEAGSFGGARESGHYSGRREQERTDDSSGSSESVCCSVRRAGYR